MNIEKPIETSGPFERTAILADPNTMRIKIAFQEREDYEAALVFFQMGDSPEEPREATDVCERSGGIYRGAAPGETIACPGCGKAVTLRTDIHATQIPRHLKRSPEEPARKPTRDAEHCDYPDCEQHWRLFIDQAATILATALACDDYKPQHAKWMTAAAAWLNIPRSPMVETTTEQTTVVYKNGTYKKVPSASAWAYQNDPDWLVTIPAVERQL